MSNDQLTTPQARSSASFVAHLTPLDNRLAQSEQTVNPRFSMMSPPGTGLVVKYGMTDSEGLKCNSAKYFP